MSGFVKDLKEAIETKVNEMVETGAEQLNNGTDAQATRQESNKVYKLDPNTPVFRKMHGEIGIDDWILTVENNMKMAQIPTTMKVNAVINYLKDTPFTLAKKHLASGDWEALKTELKEVFTPFDHERKLQENMTFLKQGDRPFEVYLEQFSTLRYQLKLDDERALIDFLKGLNAETRNQLIIFKADRELKEAIRIAAYINNSKQSKHEKVNSAVQKQITCNYCGKPNHKLIECRKRAYELANRGVANTDKGNSNQGFHQNNNHKNDNQGQQFRPNNQGQQFRPNNQGQQSRPNNQGNSQHQNQQAKSVIVCHNCKKKGHKAANCKVHKQNLALEQDEGVVEDQYERLYNQSKPHSINSAVKCGRIAENDTSERKLYKVRGFINDIEATFCIDLGATGTIMNDSFVEKHGLTTTRGHSQIMNADKHITAVESEVRCELRFPSSRVYHMNMMVMPQNEEWDVLLGNDFMEIDKPSILIADRLLLFPNGTAVHFMQDGEQPVGDDLWHGSQHYTVKIYSAVEPDDPTLFDKQWGDAENPEPLDEIKSNSKIT